MPTINKPFLLRLVLVTAALAGALFGAHALQERRIPEALKQQADRAAGADKFDQAIHYLRQYLEFCPDDVEAQVQLADLLHRRNLRSPTQRGFSELVFLYDRILRLDPDRHEIRRMALALCLDPRVCRYSDAVTHAEYLLKFFPTDAELWQQLGAAQTGLHQLPEARKSYETAITFAPTNRLAYQRLAQLLWRNMDDPAAAKVVLDQMVAAMPQEPEAYLVRARFEKFCADDESGRGHSVGDVNRAIADVNRVLELDPQNADALLLLAEILQKGRDVAAAHALLKDAVALYPKDLRLVRSLAWLELVRGNVPAAIAVLEDGLKANPDGLDLLVPLADLMVQQGDTQRCSDILARLESRKAPPIQVKYLKARIAMREARWPDAITLLESLRADTVNLPALETQCNLLLAACFQNSADSDAEEKAYRRVVNADPGNVPGRLGLANLYVNQGRFEEAVRESESAARSPYASGTVIAQWVRLKARRFKTVGAAPAEWDRLEQAVVAATPRFGPMSAEPVILLAELAAAQGKLNDAVQLLRKETARRPGDTRLWAVLASVTADLAGTAAGLTVVDEAQAAAGDGPDVRLARAALYAREPGRVRPIDPLEERIEGWSDADQFRLLYGLVEVYDSIGDRAKVIHVLKRIAARRPTDVAVWMRLFERATAAGDAKTAAEARAMVARIDGPGGPSVLVCDAVAASPSDAARVSDLLMAKFGSSPNRADACLALARSRAAVGDHPEALRLTERAFLLEPTRYETARPLVARLCLFGGDDRAPAAVRRFAADPRWAGEPFRRMIDGAMSDVPPAVAVKLLGWCEPLVAGDPDALGWLAAGYARVGAPERAAPLLDAAVNRPTATPDDWFRLALSKDPAVVLKTAGEKLKPQSYLPLAAAFVETPAGKNWSPSLPDPAAKRLFVQSRIAVKLSRSEPAEAAKVLEAYLAEKDLPKADAGWAKRNLAMLYAVGGTPADRKRAMDLIQTADDYGTTPDELRATAGVMITLSRYLEGDDRRLVLEKAIYALGTAYKETDSTRDLYHLSQVYRAAGNRVESRKCLQILLKRDPDNIYFLVAGLEELTEEGNFAVAEDFANRLRQKYPGEYRAVGAVARYECKAGRPERALTFAEGYTRAADLPAGDYLQRSARVAELLDELARLPGVRGTPTGRRMVDAAVERYAAVVPARPEGVVAICGLLAADGRVNDAFARIEQFDRYLTKRTRALAGLAAVRSGGATEREFGLVKGWLDACQAEDSESVALRLNEAEFLAVRQDLPGAARVYEGVLKRDPRNVVALNNLAWLLSADPNTAGRALELIDRATREAGLSSELLDTRARVRITLRQYDLAEKDLADATSREPTALRFFHLAVLRTAQARPQDAAAAFRESRTRGLDPTQIHPADLPTYRVLEAGEKK
jgi:tetratricopeptide (TPR) repeat protein